MFPAFLAQYAAGCYLAVALCDMQRSGWRYLRLMAILSFAIALLAEILLLREVKWPADLWREPAVPSLAAALVLGIVWLFINAGQADDVGGWQRLWPVLAGLAAMAAAVLLTLRPDATLTREPQAPTELQGVCMALSTVLGAGLLGTATAAMLLGHRYLTDTGMPIKPLSRLTSAYLVLLAGRIAWILVATVPLWSGSFRPVQSPFYFWLAVSVRLGVGVLVAGVFGWMVYDCVKRRATQSATALLYLSMLMIFIGELVGQFVMRTEHLAL